ncbi:hypothetical protein JHK85_001105 [Glycine max]|uniref:Uncharacterized protein n=3 Tax=Glycine subgen. Soja TaxID=1462606 RepID=A0A0R0LFW8_SOYBN|nr:hypothetical protein JHK87_001079 [Glycine soja]KAG5068728.1 hypothetical protein JHK85_001105 [Glycine max]KAG5088460.1 hypothetical protein JHK86_001072 [Glycine max]RZC29187.1 hypothetical protein D0Y65_000966 [Glycine soja]
MDSKGTTKKDHQDSIKEIIFCRTTIGYLIQIRKFLAETCNPVPNLSASIYSTELCNRLRAFLIYCPPMGPSSPVAELVIATSDFQRYLVRWGIGSIKGGVDAKELFHLYILVWIQDKRLSLLESCKLDKVKWSGVRTQHSTTPFVDDMYERLKETLTDYEVIICRWP